MDLYECIDHEGIQCYNERKDGSCKHVVRPFEKKFDFEKGPLKSGSGKDMVLVIPFKCEVRVKSICFISGDDGEAPQTMKLYKNEEVVDINIQEEKKAVQEIELNQGDLEYPTNMSKFTNVSKIIIGVDGSFGATRSSLKFVGLKGDKLREKTKIGETVYEVRA